ncbi:MOB kinase activator 3C isoform X1 [Octodon degus]|uniref:MOB kinase activator 3C isoform X1 n=2 Tax=Octodon degus TaxID=10160 RepID=A0A6P6F6W3_OCTDE|nr:MOB kinase activator 3C isoform X1 [Octodon degus]
MDTGYPRGSRKPGPSSSLEHNAARLSDSAQLLMRLPEVTLSPCGPAGASSTFITICSNSEEPLFEPRASPLVVRCGECKEKAFGGAVGGAKLAWKVGHPQVPAAGHPDPPVLTMALCLKQVFAKDKTFRPRKRFEPGTQRFELYKKAQASLKSGLDLRSVVRLPPGESIDDWIAVHVVDFFNRINLIYGTMAERCNETSCPVMAGGPRYEYRWQDEHQYRRPAKLSAPRYMALLMDWIEGLINDEDVFPTRVGVPFPKNFQQVCTKILTRLFRVFVHVYIHHFDSILSMGAEAHVNTCYKHFYYFIREFSLVDQRELEPLREMTERICH